MSDITELKQVVDTRALIELTSDNSFGDIYTALQKDKAINEYKYESPDETLARLKQFSKYPDRITIDAIIARNYSEMMILKTYRSIISEQEYLNKLNTTQKFCDAVFKKMKLCKNSTKRK